ncbi:MAG: hypothetical protein SFX73_14760 [Kofleriaceae bacterium]|nr:hypothetical protein [Kofleriaceae bacterium]
MMRELLCVQVVLACACGSQKQPPPKNEFEAFERDYEGETRHMAEILAMNDNEVSQATVEATIREGWRSVFIGPSGVFIDRKLVATLAELEPKHAQLKEQILANERVLADFNAAVVLDLDAQPVKVAIAALRLFTGREVFVFRRKIPTKDRAFAKTPVCHFEHKPAPPDADAPQLSVLLAPERILVALSQINEFQEIPDVLDHERDLDKLGTVLREHKTSSFFAERTDIELAVEAGTTLDVLAAIELICKAGFVDLALLEPNALTARPTL